VDKSKLIISPSGHFQNPKDILKNTLLTKEEKIIALNNWKSTCEHYKDSTNEGMPGERTTPIAEILAALRELED
jgi:hypothetical protein